ncbi:MAG: 3-hydroxy-3-methylglutaryl CoA synthase [Deltaproteobacteria bacterium]|nr:3-hydroxy-3-methylglutaryl CoA synthase [Deltaproteobacteria bacterium]
MAGIESFGAYVPLFRLAFEEIGKAWNSFAGKGERSVAGKDEDSLTMAVEAAVDCLKTTDRSEVDGLFFASTTSPFQEKQTAAAAAVAVDLNRNINTMDSLGSLRAGSAALKGALDAVKAGSNKKVLVTAADCRIGFPGSPFESILGDGAAAFLIGDTDVAVSVEGSYSISDEITDYWRKSEDRFVHFWEDRFVMVEGFQRVVPEAVKGALVKYGLELKDFAKFVCYAPTERSYWDMAKRLGFDLKTQVQMPLFSAMGNTGSAFGLMQLIACLEEAKAGDRILFATYGSGCDVFILQATDKIGEGKGAKGLARYLGSKKMLSNYQQYANFRGLLASSDERMPPIRPPATTVWRDQNSIMRFHGMKCNQCGHVQFPIHRICSSCFGKDDYREVRLSDQIAKVFSCTVDNLGYGGGAAPFWAIADFEDVRARLQIADASLEEVSIGDSLEMTFRKFPSENDVPVYGWKGRVIR